MDFELRLVVRLAELGTQLVERANLPSVLRSRGVRAIAPDRKADFALRVAETHALL